MQKFDREATFLCSVLEHAVSKTTNEFPQLVVKLQANKIYDDENEQWVDCSGWEMGGVGYFVLFGGNGKATSNKQQIMKATGWVGTSFADLATLDLSNTEVLIRVQFETYKNKERFNISWIDNKDADPVRQLRSCNADDLKALDAQYGSVMREDKPTVPATATVKKSPSPPKSGSPKPRGRPPKAGKPAPPPVPVKTPPSVDFTNDKLPIIWDQEHAWDDVYTKCIEAGVDEKTIAEEWTAAIYEVSVGKGDDAIDPEGWGKVRATVLEAHDDIPF